MIANMNKGKKYIKGQFKYDAACYLVLAGERVYKLFKDTHKWVTYKLGDTMDDGTVLTQEVVKNLRSECEYTGGFYVG